MLTADVRFEGWTTEDWTRFLQIFKPRAISAEDEASRPRGGVIVVREDKRIRKMLFTPKGRVDPPEGEAPPLAELVTAHHGSWGLSLEIGALDDLMERFGARARRSEDFLEQTLRIITIVRELMDEGAIESYPRRLRGLPVPTPAMVSRTLDTLCGEGRVMCLGLFKDAALYTSLVLRRRGSGFDVVAGPDDIRGEMGLLSGDFRRDQRHLIAAVQARYGMLSLGCFAEFDSFRELQLDARPGAWGRAVAMRDVVLSPLPPGIAIALGFDGVRVVAENLREVASRVDPFGIVEPALAAMRQRLGSVAGSHDVENALGFDPMAALRALLRR